METQIAIATAHAPPVLPPIWTRIPTWRIRVDGFLGNMEKIQWLQRRLPPDPDWLMITGETWRHAAQKAGTFCLPYMQQDVRLNVYQAGWMDAVCNFYGTEEKVLPKDSNEAVIGDRYWQRHQAFVNALLAMNQVLQPGNDYDNLLIRQAASTAQLYAMALSLEGMPGIKPEHITHVRNRWCVWARGYALYADVGGRLVVCQA